METVGKANSFLLGSIISQCGERAGKALQVRVLCVANNTSPAHLAMIRWKPLQSLETEWDQSKYRRLVLSVRLFDRIIDVYLIC